MFELDSSTQKLRLREEFARWTFTMPGYEVRLDEDIFGGQMRLVVLIKTRDTYKPDDPTIVSHQFMVPPYLLLDCSLSDADYAEAVGQFVRNSIHCAMRHEADKWLRREWEVSW